ncbi:DUF488 domain-containing protein [Actinokineospora sp. 24-640]
MAMIEATCGRIGVGYEGRNLEGFVADLVAAGVGVLADVRHMPLSRKRGFSKTALSTALEDAGIGYVHLRALGNPKANRAGFGGNPAELDRARANYRSLLAEPMAKDAVAELVELARGGLVAVMCFEADERRCHRDVVLQELDRLLNV